MSRWLRVAEVNDVKKLSEAWRNLYNLLSTTDDNIPGIQEALGIQPSLNTIGVSDIPNEHDESAYKRALNEVYNLLNRFDETYPKYHNIYVKLMDASEIPSISNFLGE